MAADGHAVRDIKNHLLFEIATEVAHRGEFHPVPHDYVTMAAVPVPAQRQAGQEELTMLTC